MQEHLHEADVPLWTPLEELAALPSPTSTLCQYALIAIGIRHSSLSRRRQQFADLDRSLRRLFYYTTVFLSFLVNWKYLYVR